MNEQAIKDTLYFLYRKGFTTKNNYNTGLENFESILNRLKEGKPFITIHQPTANKSCSMRLWMMEPIVGTTGHPDTGNGMLIAEEWLAPEKADEFIKKIKFIKFIATKGEGGSFAEKGTKLYQVE